MFATTSNRFLNNFVITMRRCNPGPQETFKTLEYRPSLLLLAVFGIWKCAAKLPKMYSSFRLFIILCPSSEERHIDMKSGKVQNGVNRRTMHAAA